MDRGKSQVRDNRQNMSVERQLAEALKNAIAALYNPFEPDNQCREYLNARATLAAYEAGKGEEPVAWLVRALVRLAIRNLADANRNCGDCWPAGQEWHELGHTSQHSFMRRATTEAGIPHEEYRLLIENASTTTDLDSVWQELEKENEKNPLYASPIAADRVSVPRELLENLIEHTEEKLAYVLSAYGPTFRNKAKELRADIDAAKSVMLAAEKGAEGAV